MKITVNSRLNDRGESVEVSWICGEYAIHRSIDNPFGFTLTHVPSGLAIARNQNFDSLTSLAGDVEFQYLMRCMICDEKGWLKPSQAVQARLRQVRDRVLGAIAS